MIWEVKHPQLHFFNDFEIAGTKRAVAERGKNIYIYISQKSVRPCIIKQVSSALYYQRLFFSKKKVNAALHSECRAALTFFFEKKSLKSEFAPALLECRANFLNVRHPEQKLSTLTFLKISQKFEISQNQGSLMFLSRTLNEIFNVTLRLLRNSEK